MPRFSYTLTLALCVAIVTSGFVHSVAEAEECGKNAHAVTSYSHSGCYENCQNKDQVRPCLAILYHGHFCECDTGFIYLNGTAGDCVKSEDCPK